MVRKVLVWIGLLLIVLGPALMGGCPSDEEVNRDDSAALHAGP